MPGKARIEPNWEGNAANPWVWAEFRKWQGVSRSFEVWYAGCFSKVTCDGRTGARATKSQVPKEQHNEGNDECKAGNQDRDPDDGNGRYFRGSERSNPSRRRRRPTHSVPTQAAELHNHSATDVS